MCNLLNLSQKDVSRLAWDGFVRLLDYNFDMRRQKTNRCLYRQSGFARFCCLEGWLRPISYAQTRKNRRTRGEAVELLPWGLLQLLVLLPRLKRSLSSYSCYWFFQSESKLSQNSKEILWKPYHIVGSRLDMTSMTLINKASISIIVWSYSKYKISKNVTKIEEQKIIRKEEKLSNETTKGWAYQIKN